MSESQNPVRVAFIPPSTWQPQQEQELKWKVADYIALGALAVNIVMIIVTLMLFNEAVRSRGVAEASAKAAKDAADEAKKSNEQARIAFESSEKSGAQSFQLSKDQFKAQMNSYATQEKEFRLLNSSEIRISPEFLISVTDDLIKVEHKLVNFKLFPAEIISKRGFILSARKINPDSLLNLALISRNMAVGINRVVVSQSTPLNGELILAFNQQNYPALRHIKAGDFSIFIAFIVEYKDIVLGTKTTYSTVVRLVYQGTQYPFVEFLK